jgi:amidohydrolase
VASRDVRKAIWQRAEQVSPRWIKLSDKIHANPETSFEEFKASTWLSEAFAGLGFSVETGVGGISTAFRATFDGGKPGPIVGVLIEYDALKDLGHACAHNTKGPAALCGLEAFLREVPGFSGRIIVYGCPAEESGGGKVLMTEAGVFSDSDLCLELGVAADFGTGARFWASQGMEISFRGVSGHAGLKHGNAVNAVEPLLFVLGNLDYLRARLGDKGLLHAVITSGGTSPGVVPERAQALIRVRTRTPRLTESYVAHVKALANLAAEVSGASVATKTDLLYSDYVKCPSLTQLIFNNFREMGIEADWLLDFTPRGSSDVGNVSHVVPTETIYVGLGHGLAAHTPAYREAAGGEPGHNVVINGGKILASCLLDLLTGDSGALLAKVREEFAQGKAAAE